MLNIESVSRHFGQQVLLDNTGFQINPGERVGLVGRNGHGKTTLLNMIAGSDHPDDGRISHPSGYKLGVLSQKIVFSKKTVLEEAMSGLSDEEQHQHWKAQKILAGLGFSMADMEKHPGIFSGGFQVRLNLARMLVSDPDLLLLDEPTNYLDITSIRWIARFLVSWPRELLLVTHDRSFMDQVVTHIAGIHRQKIKKIQGDTSKYYLQVAQDEAVWEKTRLNQEKKTREMELFISRFRAKARLASMVQSRVKTLEKTKTKEKLQKLKTLEFSFNELPFSGKQLMEVTDITFGWEKENPLIKNLSFTVYPKDRIGVIGKNGKGKTTLLKLLSKNLLADSGDIRTNPGAAAGYFEQTNITSLNDGFTVEEELQLSCPAAERQAVRNICGAMMFQKDAALKKISMLSGGEKSRVMLGKLLMTPLNLLLLDEPSNHLDMESCDSLVCALDNFEGALIMVTHNEMFLHSLANRLVVFTDQGIELFEGSYQEFLDKKGWGDEETIVKKKEKVQGISKKEMRQKKSSIISEKSKAITPVKKKIEQVENEIDANEKLLKNVNDELLQASMDQDGEKIQTLSRELSHLETLNETLFETLENHMNRFDEITLTYDEKLGPWKQ